MVSLSILETAWEMSERCVCEGVYRGPWNVLDTNSAIKYDKTKKNLCTLINTT